MNEQITQDMVIAALKNVVYPNFKKDIVAFGFVKSVVLHDRALALRIDIPSSDEAVAAQLRADIEKNIAPLKVNLKLDIKTPQIAPDPKPAQPVQRNIAPEISHFVMISSGKGGVGKSTTSVNLAISLAQMGLRVGLLDADIYGPNIPRMLGIEHKKPALDPEGKKLLPLEVFGLKAMSMGVLYDEKQSLIWRGPMVMRAIQQMLSDILWGKLDVLVIDMPPGTGDAQLTLAQVVPVSAGVSVTTPQLVSLDDSARSLDMFKKLHIPIAGIIENMSGFLCDCGKMHDLFGRGKTKALADEFETEVLAEIPLKQSIREGGDIGRPLAFYAPTSISAQKYRKIAEKIWEFLEKIAAQKKADNSAIQPTGGPGGEKI